MKDAPLHLFYARLNPQRTYSGYLEAGHREPQDHGGRFSTATWLKGSCDDVRADRSNHQAWDTHVSFGGCTW